MIGSSPMFEKFANIFRIPDLRKRVLFTMAMLAVYRLGGHIPTPGVNTAALEQFFNSQSGSSLGLVDMFSGGNLRRLTIFALGIMPYITASIIFQLLTVVYEPLARLQKEGELGRRKITQWTRYLTVILGVVQSMTIAIALSHASGGMVLNPGPGFILMTVLTLTAGTAFIMWLGEQITDRGIGNGMSLLIFAGIVVGLPRAIAELVDTAKTEKFGAFTVPALILLVACMIAVVAFIVFVERSERRIPVQYAKRIVGRRLMGGQSTHLAAQGQLRRRDAGHLCGFRAVGSAAVFAGRDCAQQRRAHAHLRSASPGRALVRAHLHGGDRLLRLLLYFDRLPSG